MVRSHRLLARAPLLMDVRDRDREIEPVGGFVFPPSCFSDRYAPADPRFAGEGRGPASDAVAGLIAGDCCGCARRPTAAEFHEAVRAPRPTPRQRVVAAALLRAASNDTLAVAYLQGAFTWRQAAAALRRAGACGRSRARYLNRHALFSSTSLAVSSPPPRLRVPSCVRGVGGLVLPEPARAFWAPRRAAFARLVAVPGGGSRLILGGGSVLAARWGHRRPGQLAVLFPERDALNDALPGGDVDLAAAHRRPRAGAFRAAFPSADTLARARRRFG